MTEFDFESELAQAINPAPTPPTALDTKGLAPPEPGSVSGASTAKSLWPDAIVALGKGLALTAMARRNKRGAPAPPAFGTSGGGVRGGPLTAGSGIKPPAGIGRRKSKSISL